MKSPCYGCVERQFGCHGGCKRYRDWKSEHDILKSKELEERRRESELTGLSIRAVERSKR